MTDTDPEYPSPTRRSVLACTTALTVGGLAGCLGDDGDEQEGCPSGEVTVEGPDGTTNCAEPVETPQTIGEYYNYGGGQADSASTTDGLEANDATVLFVYRNTDSGDRSLVVINGDATTGSSGGGRAPVTIEGAGGAEWLVQDGPAGTGGGDQDPYQTASGTVGDSETALWGWDDTKTDGGALGPLGESFALTVTLEDEATVGETTTERTGLDRLLLVDGADLDAPVELAAIEGENGPLTVELSG